VFSKKIFVGCELNVFSTNFTITYKNSSCGLSVFGPPNNAVLPYKPGHDVPSSKWPDYPAFFFFFFKNKPMRIGISIFLAWY